MTIHEIEVLDAMEELGGSFVSKLAKAWRYADDHNFGRLKGAFRDYWEEYEGLVERREESARQAREDSE